MLRMLVTRASRVCLRSHLHAGVQLASIDRGGKKRRIIKMDKSEMNKFVNLELINGEFEAELHKLQEQYAQQLSTKNSLRAFETLPVQLPDSSNPVQLSSIGQISLKNNRVAIINMASKPEAIKAVVHAIDKSGLDVGCQQQGQLIYVPLPRPSREKREILAKNAKLLFNQCHDKLRVVMRKHELLLRKREHEVPKEVYRSLIFFLEEAVRQSAHKGETMMRAKQNELLAEL